MGWWVAAIGAVLLFGSRTAASGAPAISSPEDFIRIFREALGVVAPHLSVLARQMVIAHAAFESGWGKSRPAKLGSNFFNITRIRSDPRPVIESGDQECDAQGVCRPITQRFAKYGSLAEGLADYFRLLSGPRYAAALARLEVGDPTGFVVKLREGGYFTLPLDQYRETFAGVLRSVQRRWI